MNFDQLNPLNAWAIKLIESIRNPSLSHIVIYITNLGSPIGLTILAGVVAIILWLQGKKIHMKQFVVTLLVGSILVGLIKIIVQLPRPTGGLISETGYSFVSGHATYAVIFFSLIAYSYKSHIKSVFLRWLLVTTSILIALLVGFSRVYLGVHYLTDVLGGFILGAVVSVVSILILESKKR